MNPFPYKIEIQWSADDNAYLASVPALPGCMADGPTLADACGNAVAVAQMWIDTAKELGRSIPQEIHH